MTKFYLLIATCLTHWATAQTPAFEATLAQSETLGSEWRLPTTGKTFVEDIFNNANAAISLNSNHNGMSLDFSSNLNLKKEGTIEFFYNHSGKEGAGYLSAGTTFSPIFFMYSNESSNNIDAFSFGLNINNKPYIKSGSRIILNSTSDLGWSKWNHYVITYKVEANNGYFKVYRDGKIYLQAPLNQDFSNNIGTKMFFGSYSNNDTSHTASTKGYFNNIKVYSSALSETQIRDNFENMFPILRGTETSFYKFDNNLEDTINTRDAETGAGTISYVTDVHNTNSSAASFNAHSNTADTFAEIPSSINEKLGEAYTISFAFNLNNITDDNSSNWTRPIISIPTTGNNPIIIGVRKNSIGVYPMSVQQGGYVNSVNGLNITKDSWNFATIIFNNNQATVYLNGVRVMDNQYLNNFNMLLSASKPILIGKSEAPLDWFRGYVDNLIIDNKAYSAQDAIGAYFQWLSNFSNMTVDPSLSTKTVANVNSKTLKIYPNPVSDFLSISSEGTINTIKIYSTSGQLIRTYYKTDKIDVRGLAKGNYFVSVEQTNGRISATQFIKK